MSESSLRTLASTLDDLAATGGALVTESPDNLVVSELSADAATIVAHKLGDVSWAVTVFDRANTETAPEDLQDSFGPFRASAGKPARSDGATMIVTAAGFSDILLSDQESGTVALVGLDHPIATEGMRFLPEDHPAVDPLPGHPFRSPRTVVREYGSKRVVPRSIDRWLLVEPATWHEDDSRFRLWVSHAVRAIVPALPTEIDQHSEAYVFRGPPRLALASLRADENYFEGIGREGFQNLQAAARWVYELDREAESRHTLLASEFARTGSAGEGTVECLRENIGHALEGAKIAHAMSVAKVSADNLKALADLRKAVTDETGKIADAARQVVGALASALAVGIGLIAARMAANAPGPLILAVMSVVAAYIFVVIYSGYKFAALQRSLRDLWRNQIYRFLSPDEYQKLVIQPSLDAEKILTRVSLVGGIAVAATFAVAAWMVIVPGPANLETDGAAPPLPAALIEGTDERSPMPEADTGEDHLLVTTPPTEGTEQSTVPVDTTETAEDP